MKQIFLAVALFLIFSQPVYSVQPDDVPSNDKVKPTPESTSLTQPDTPASPTVLSTSSASLDTTPSAEITPQPSPTPSATPTPTPTPKSPLAKFFESETNRAATLFTVAVLLILIGFLAGRHSDNFDGEDESEE